ncbi:hypothetical protein CTheo_3044 [Ceratobasidium theobromae]|uniref:Transposable element Tcb2 transposase n=1 Tax=Ceratobasidium theobromae TaxID=1582974 RepID=A0A5N5QQR4_9AGAM|nr:hypothetical protein CTheo_3044 [Ceratobasidium theobromae]
MAPNTTSETKAKIVLLKDMGYSDRAVAKLLGDVHSTTVSRIAHCYANGCPVTEKTPRPGRPCILTPSDVRFAALALTQLKPATAWAIKKAYFPHVSTPTIQRHLRSLGLRTYRRCRVPLLTRRHRKARLGWCRMRLLWSQAQWDDIVFSDETRLKVFGSDGPDYYWKYPNQSPYDPRFTKKTVSHGGGSVFIWGCIMQEGVGRIHRIDGKLNAAKYINILWESFLGTLADYRLSPFDIIFQHDRDPKHTAWVTQRWLESRHINVLPWPARSPDLNIIEHVWAHLKTRVYSHNPPPQNREELWSVIQQEWKEINPDYIASLYKSMPRRVEAVYAAKGGNTWY